MDSKKTLYLDEIDRFAKVDQAYWLELIRASERGEPNAPRRILASTNCDLDALSRAGQFDQELAHCLLRFVVTIPTLRERAEDFGSLVEHLSVSVSARMGRRRVTFSASALRLLQAQPWPGNVAQLHSIIEKLIAFAADGHVTKRCVISVLTDCPGSIDALRHSATERQRDALIAMLDATGGNLAEAARRMKMSRGAVIYRAQKFGLLGQRIRTDRPPRRARSSRAIDPAFDS
jgi:DNA-binding NtrC family response regulator